MKALKQELSFGGTEAFEEDDDADNDCLTVIVSYNGSEHQHHGAHDAFPLEEFSKEEQTPPSQDAVGATTVVVDNIEEFHNFELGDHVYMWSKMRQLHGLVVHVDGDGIALIADFSLPPLGAKESSSKTKKSDDNCHRAEVVSFQFKRERVEHTKWRKVQYGVKKWERAVKPPGTCTCEISSAPKMILDRLNFLMLHYQLVPRSHAIISNSETIAFWCTTGQWRALQMNQILDISNTASVVGTGTLATYAAAESAGLCCFIGAELAVSAPFLLPAIAVGSLAAGGATVWNTHRMRREWKRVTERLNREFDRFQLLYEEGLAEPPVEEIDAELQFRNIVTSRSPGDVRSDDASFQKVFAFFRKQRPKAAQLTIV